MMRRRASLPVLAPWVVRPGRLSAVNDNARSAGRTDAARRSLVRFVLFSAAFAAAIAVASCGRRGAPELPASAANEPRVPVDVTDPQGTHVPNRKFVLDPILQ